MAHACIWLCTNFAEDKNCRIDGSTSGERISTRVTHPFVQQHLPYLLNKLNVQSLEQVQTSSLLKRGHLIAIALIEQEFVHDTLRILSAEQKFLWNFYGRDPELLFCRLVKVAPLFSPVRATHTQRRESPSTHVFQVLPSDFETLCGAEVLRTHLRVGDVLDSWIRQGLCSATPPKFALQVWLPIAEAIRTGGWCSLAVSHAFHVHRNYKILIPHPWCGEFI